MKYILSLCIILFAAIALQSEELEAPKYSAYSGRHFFVSFMQNEIELSWQKDDVQLRIFLTAVIPTKYEVKIPGYQTIIGELKANDVKEIEISYQLEIRQSEIALAKAIEITSELPVSVYCFSSKITTSESYSAIPISRWGNEYVVMSYPNDQYDDPERWNLDSLERFVPRSSEFMVMAAYDSTIVSMAPRAVTKGGKQRMQNYNVVLNAGEVYLVQSFPAERGQADLTGTIVRSNKPIGLLSGHVRSAVPQTNSYPYDSKDHLVEMLAPTNTWGKFFCTIPFGVNLKGDLFRVAGIYPNTIVTLQRNEGEEEELFMPNPGDWVEVTDISTASVWRGNKPFQLVQYMRHTGEYGDSKEYDPSIVVIPPVEQFVQDIVFLTPRNFQVQDQYREHRVSLIADAPALNDLSVDGDAVKNMTDFFSQQIPGTSLYWGSIALSEGRHHLSSSKGRFSGILYAYGFHDSYAMALGNSLSNPFRQDSLPPTLVVAENCGFVNGFVHDIHDTNSSGIDFGWVVKYRTNNYQWDMPTISDTATVVSFTARPINIYQDGSFEIEFYDKNSNMVKYTLQYKGIKVTVPKEILYPNLSWQSEECKEFKVFNFGNRVMTLDSITIANENRLHFTSSKPIPAKIMPGDTITFTLCFNPKGDSATLFSSINFHFDCNYLVKIPVKGNVRAPEIAIGGVDFGDVQLGQSKCDSILIENLGNTDLLIDDLLLSSVMAEFQFKYSGILPKLLKSGQSLKLEVCFYPLDTIVSTIDVSAKNDFDLVNTAIVTGRGIAPSINSIRLDWGNRRIGTSSDSLMYFVNTGNQAGLLKFKSLLIGEPILENADVLMNVNTILQPNQELPLLFTYNPTAPIPYSIKAEYSTDWALHSPIEVWITGQGTIPTIDTYNFRFDTTRIFIDIDSTMLAIKAGGNERLTLDQIQIIGGDAASFAVNLPKYDNSLLLPNDELYIPISFTPKRVGEHKLLLEVTSDALPNYMRKKDTITVSGYALPADTIDYDVNLVLPDLFACVQEQGYFEIRNTGNININLQKIDLERIPDNFVAEFINDVNSLLPIKIEPSQTQRFDMKFYAERNTGGKLNFDLQINDSINRLISYDLMPIVTQIELFGPDNIEVTPGDTISVFLKGRFPMGVDPIVPVKIQIAIDNYFLELLEKNGNLKITNSKEEINYPIQFVQTRKNIEFDFGRDSMKIDEMTEWETKLTFMALLYDKDATTLSLGAFSDPCFDAGLKNIPTKLLHICNFNLRPIKLIGNLPFVNIAPNPISSKIGVEVFLTEDDIVNLSIVDAMGKRTEIENSRHLTKGKHYLEYSSDGLSSGVYTLIMNSKQIKQNKIFIITK